MSEGKGTVDNSVIVLERGRSAITNIDEGDSTVGGKLVANGFPCVRGRSRRIIRKDEVFNFVIAKISATTEITEFREIRSKFRRNFFRD